MEELERLRALEQTLAQRVTEGEEELARGRAASSLEGVLAAEPPRPTPPTKPPLALRAGRALRRAWPWGRRG